MIKKIVIGVSIVVLALGGLYGYLLYRGKSLPDNNPIAFTEKHPGKTAGKVIVCLGDSITHGSVSCNYVDELSGRLNSKGYTLVNAGVNSHLAYNALLRVKEVAACNPDFVTVLIGTNDANATMAKDKEDRYIKDMKLPQHPNKAWYRANLKEICRQLKSITKARIALLSLPPMGEDPNTDSYRRAAEYSGIVKEVAAEEHVTYLPLFEGMNEHLKGRATPLPHTFEETDKLMYFSILRHYLFFTSYDDISSSNGFILLVDFLHLNCTGAGMVADLIQDFVTQ